MVGTGNTHTNEPSDAAVVRVHGSKKGLAVTTDCNSRYVYADPYKGGMIAVSEAARNIVCSGGLPVAITNCLNFGNPYNPEVYYQFVNAIKGMGDACRRLGTPVTGGNVSFYNQSEDGPVYPTPTIGMVGTLDDLDQKMTMFFKNDGDVIYLIGNNPEDMNCSEYLHHICGVTHSSAPHFNLDEEFILQDRLLQIVRNKQVQSAHDISEGGLFVTLIESAMKENMGFEIHTDSNARKDAFLFGEAQSRVVVSVSWAKQPEFEAMLGDVPFAKIGTVKAGGHVTIDGESWGIIKDWKDAYDTAIENLLNS